MSATDPTLPFERPGPLRPPPAYARLRADAPVARVVTPEGQRAWLVTSYDDAVGVLTDTRFRLAPPGLESTGNDTLFQDGDSHTRLRRLVSKAFTPRAITAMRPHIERLADEQVAAFAAAGPPADLVAGLAAPLATQVIGDLLGVAIEERDRFETLVEVLSGDFTADEEAAAAAAQAWDDLTRYAADLVAAKRRVLGDDLLSALIGVRDAQDGRLGDGELIGMVISIIAAGHQTSRNAISVGVIQLVTEDRLDGLADSPELDAVVEEVLRRLAGLIAEPFPRWAHEKADLGGASIEPGDLVLVRLEAANHDPRRFADPDRFTPGRDSAGAHVSFGRGPHHCLGASLARIELTAAFSALARRLPGLRLRGDVEDLVWVRGQTDAGPTAVPVTW
ncbi:cytochrome P450 [Actinomadura rugatobispora]|uniref:Cytochrome P450 n=1 Tax=Actinomadura rugatobispora TaxID=1994 RepID=A0ABW0ZPL4_9ACTN|nr:cytochrome P450 [Actinomadura rugatobispora]